MLAPRCDMGWSSEWKQVRWGEREAEPPGRQVPVDRHVWRAEEVERGIWRAGAEIEVPDDQVRPSPGDPQAGDKALLDVERQRRAGAEQLLKDVRHHPPSANRPVIAIQCGP